jgi:hypothetical protein
MTHLKLCAISTCRASLVNHLNGTLKTTVMVVSYLSDNEGSSRTDFKVTYFNSHAISPSG